MRFFSAPAGHRDSLQGGRGAAMAGRPRRQGHHPGRRQPGHRMETITPDPRRRFSVRSPKPATASGRRWPSNRIQGRSGKGIISVKTTERNGWPSASFRCVTTMNRDHVVERQDPPLQGRRTSAKSAATPRACGYSYGRAGDRVVGVARLAEVDREEALANDGLGEEDGE